MSHLSVSKQVKMMTGNWQRLSPLILRITLFFGNMLMCVLFLCQPVLGNNFIYQYITVVTCNSAYNEANQHSSSDNMYIWHDHGVLSQGPFIPEAYVNSYDINLTVNDILFVDLGKNINCTNNTQRIDNFLSKTNVCVWLYVVYLY